MFGFFHNRGGHLTPLLCSLVMAGIWLFVITIVGHEPGKPEVYLIAALLGMLMVAAVALWLQQQDLRDADSHLDDLGEPDPWEMQRQLMIASDQTLPRLPTINNGGILYALLIMEETGETLEGLAKVMARLPDQSPEVLSMTNTFAGFAHRLKAMSIVHRENLTRVTIDEPLTPEEAVELFDGTTDISVVNCGFAVALGLPGAAGYNEVARSNLSKINPDTGVIDKTTDGKWIKGRNFFKPNLAYVLHNYRPINDNEPADAC